MYFGPVLYVFFIDAFKVDIDFFPINVDFRTWFIFFALPYRKTIFSVVFMKLWVSLKYLCFYEVIVVEWLVFWPSNNAFIVNWLIFSFALVAYFLFQKTFLFFHELKFFVYFFVFFCQFLVLRFLQLFFLFNLFQLFFKRFCIDFKLLFNSYMVSYFSFVFLKHLFEILIVRVRSTTVLRKICLLHLGFKFIGTFHFNNQSGSHLSNCFNDLF